MANGFHFYKHTGYERQETPIREARKLNVVLHVFDEDGNAHVLDELPDDDTIFGRPHLYGDVPLEEQAQGE